MARKRNLFNKGTLSASVGGALTDVTLQSAEFATLPVVASPDTLTLVLDYDSTSATPEVVLVTAHSSGATTLTVTRQQETGTGGSAVRSHAINTKWVHAATPLDWDHGNLDGLADDDHPQYMKLADAQTVTGAKTFSASITATATTSNFGAGAAGAASSSYVQVGDLGNAAAGDVYARAQGTLANVNLNLRALGTGVVRIQSGSGTNLAQVDSTGEVWAVGENSRFGAGALGGAGTYVNIGSLASPNDVYLDARGTPSNVGLRLRSKGTSSVHIDPGATGASVLEATPGGEVKVSGDLKVANRSMPRGIISLANWSGPNNQAYTTETTITGLSAAVAVVGGRRYRVAVKGLLLAGSLETRVLGVVRIDGTGIDRWVDYTGEPGHIELHCGEVYWEPASSGTFTVTASLSSSADTISINNGAKCQMAIEDVGVV